MEEKQNNTKEINKYFQHTVIDVEKPLSYIDIYAYLHKVDNAIEKLHKILDKEMPDVLKKDFVINEIVKPIKTMGIEKQFKQTLIDDIKLHNKIKDENIKKYFQNREIKPETPLWHKDIYAFLVQNNMQGRGLLKEFLKVAANINLKDGSLEKDYLVDIVRDIKSLGADVEKELKTKMAESVQQNKNIKQKLS